MSNESSFTLVIEADNHPQALPRILDRIALLQIGCAAISARVDASRQKAVIELIRCTPERALMLSSKLSAMPCVRAACVLPQS